MPYYIVDKTLPHETQDDVRGLTAYASRDAAFRDLADPERANGRTPRTHKVAYVETPEERADWRARESARFDDGTYRHCPWVDRDACLDHFVHLSVDKDAMIAYTPNAEYGHADRQVRVRPGRYLAEFYSDRTKSWREMMVAAVQAELETLQIAYTPADIEKVYRNARGFASCMGPDTHVDFDYQWPTRVYGNSDLAIAYTGPIDAATSRCVIWPERKLYSRLYGLTSHLEHRLEAAGYQHGSMRGAHIRQVYEDGNLIMPYVDGVSWCEKVTYNGQPMLRLGSGSIPTDPTCGYVTDHDDNEQCAQCGDSVSAGSLDANDHCADCAERYHTCEHCRDHFWADPDTADQTMYCDTCENSRQWCDVCESDTWDTVYEVPDGSRSIRYACEHCTEHHEDSRYTCEVCDSDDQEWQIDLDLQREREDNGLARRVCCACVDQSAVVCHVCQYAYMRADHETDVCPSCGIVPRCPHTGDLLDPDLANDSDLQRARAIATAILTSERLRRELADSAQTFHDTGILTEVSAHA